MFDAKKFVLSLTAVAVLAGGITLPTQAKAESNRTLNEMVTLDKERGFIEIATLNNSNIISPTSVIVDGPSFTLMYEKNEVFDSTMITTAITVGIAVGLEAIATRLGLASNIKTQAGIAFLTGWVDKKLSQKR